MSHSMLSQQMDSYALEKHKYSKIEVFFCIMIKAYYLYVKEDKHKNPAREQHIILQDEFFSRLLNVVCVVFAVFHRLICSHLVSFPNNLFLQDYHKIELLYHYAY